VVGPGAIIAQSLRGVAPEEDRTGVADPVQPFLRLGDRELEVLGSNAVGDVAGLFQIPRPDERPALAERCGDDFAPGHSGEQGVDALRDSIDESGGGRNEDRLR